MIAAATGPVVSGPALLLGLADLVVMSSEAVAFVSGPQMVAEFTGIQVGINELGGTATHATSSGLCAVESDDVDGAVAELLEYLPSNTDEVPPLAAVSDSVLRPTPELRNVIPDRKAATYDARDVVRSLCDDGSSGSSGPGGRGQIVTAFARLGGMPVGFVANQPRILAGTLDIAASQKAARFVRLCDAFNLPIVSLVDTPGFLPGQGPRVAGHDPPRGRAGLRLRAGDGAPPVPHPPQGLRRRLHRHGLPGDRQRRVPGLAGGRGGRHGGLGRRADPVPRVSSRRRGPSASSPTRSAYLNPWPAAERGLVDEVIDPADSRIVLCSVLRQLCTKRELVVGRKHDAGPQ